jgi:hypothetical protein
MLSQGCLDELVIKGPARLTALSKRVRCSGGPMASSALGWKRLRRASIASIGILPHPPRSSSTRKRANGEIDITDEQE